MVHRVGGQHAPVRQFEQRRVDVVVDLGERAEGGGDRFATVEREHRDAGVSGRVDVADEEVVADHERALVVEPGPHRVVGDDAKDRFVGRRARREPRHDAHDGQHS